jgi:carbon monoxide dehydrogenase subunit G
LAINFSGEFTTPRSQEEVFDFLSDPNKFAPLLPDFQSMSMQDATHFTVKVKVGVGNIRGSAEIKMELSEAVEPQRAQYKGQGSAVGSQVTVSAGFDLSPTPEGTRVLWQGETSVFGKLASMAGGMLEPLGRKNIQKLIEGLQKALSEPLATSMAPEAQALQAPAMEASGATPASREVLPEAASAARGELQPDPGSSTGDDSSPNGETDVAQNVSPGSARH